VISFHTNNAVQHGGVFFITESSHVTFNESSDVHFTLNNATSGGVLYSEKYCTLSFDQYSKVAIINNSAYLSEIGLRQLCRHNFEHNRLAKALSIMPA